MHGNEKTTNSEGNVEFTMPDGEYDYGVTKEGYKNKTGMIKVTGADIEHGVTLKQLTGTLTGHVIEVCPSPECNPPRPDPVPEAHVTVLSGEQVVGEAWTDERGNFDISDIPASIDLVVKAEFWSGWESGVVELKSDVVQVYPNEKTVTDLIHIPNFGPKLYTVSFTVNDGENMIEDAMVNFGGWELFTDSNGKVRFFVPDEEFGFEYVVRADGYENITGIVELNGTDVEEKITLKKGIASVTGQVLKCSECGSDNTPIPLNNVEIKVYENDEVIGTGTTDKHGNYTIGDLPTDIGFTIQAIYKGETNLDLIKDIYPLYPGESYEVDFNFRLDKDTDEDFIYKEMEDGNAEIIGYEGSGGIVNIPSKLGDLNVTSIGYAAFSDKNIYSVNIPVTVTNIGNRAFMDNELRTIKIPEGVETIGVRAFRGNELERAELPNSLKTISMEAFYSNEITSLKLPNNLTSIGENAFSYNQLTAITIPDSVETISKNAFYGNQLTEVIIPMNVKSIGGYAFYGNQLNKVTIEGASTTILEKAFGNNQSNPEDLTIIGHENAVEYAKADRKSVV